MANNKTESSDKNEFSYRKVSEEDKEKIKLQAKHLLEEFGSKLDKINLKEIKKPRQKSQLREDGKGWETDSEFRDTMLCNAPLSEDGYIVAEKGGWKK